MRTPSYHSVHPSHYRGSHRSGAFMTPGCINPRKFNMTPRKGAKLDWAKLNEIHHADSDPSYLVSFSHTKLRPLVAPDKTKLATFFERYFVNKPKRIRELGMLREPMALRASAHAMLQCAINRKVKQFNSQRESEGLGAICTPEEGLNVSALWDERVEQYMSNCPKSSKDDSYEYIDKYNRMLCENGQQSLEHCRGATQLLESGRPYNMAMRALLRGLMGRYTAEEEDKHEVSSEQVEEYTLFDLGGIMNVSNDFVWFGITERMDESTCLLYYTLRIKPLNQTPTSRVMDCSPTSWWTDENREKVKQMEPSDYAVWRAANAILDIRIMIMQEDIHSKLNNEKDLTRREIDQNRALAEAGCLQLS